MLDVICIDSVTVDMQIEDLMKRSTKIGGYEIQKLPRTFAILELQNTTVERYSAVIFNTG